MTISLHAFAKQHDLPKSSVHSRAQSLGIDTSNGLSYEAQTLLLREFDKEAAPQTKVEQGNHRNALTLTVGSDAASLEQFRTDRIQHWPILVSSCQVSPAFSTSWRRGWNTLSLSKSRSCFRCVNSNGVFRAFGDARKFDKLEKLLP